MPRRPLPDDPYTPPKPGEPFFTCLCCKRPWHGRFLSERRPGWCRNCDRRARRSTRDVERTKGLRRSHGLDADRARRLLKEQDGRCKVCRRPISFSTLPSTRRDDAVVDHDHASGDVRGVLCGRCDTAIGLFGDDPNTIASASAYLMSPPAISGEVLHQEQKRARKKWIPRDLAALSRGAPRSEGTLPARGEANSDVEAVLRRLGTT